MTPNLPRALVEVSYEQAARDYQRKLPPEHYMESTAQATQRKITLVSFDLVAVERPDVHVFNELLVQYPRPGRRKPGQVVPDNMAVQYDGPLTALTSFNLPLQPARPFMVFEYVSRSNKRKDYDASFKKYEQDLQVPYYLLFYPDVQELTLFRHDGTKYHSTPPNEQGRYPVPELELEVGLLDGWVCYWFRGRLLPLPADLQRELEAARRQAEAATQQAEAANRQAAVANQQAEAANRQAEVATQQAEAATRRADELQRRTEELARHLAAEQEARLALERELAQSRAQRPPEP